MTRTFTEPAPEGINAHIFKNTLGAIFDFAVAFYRANQCWPTAEIIRENLPNMKTSVFNRTIQQGVSLGILRPNGIWIMALVPPHVTIMDEVCTSLGVPVSDVTGRCRTLKAIRARRIICKRLLSRPTPYNYAMVQRVIYKHTCSILDYLDLDRASKRSEERKARKRQSQNAELQPSL